MGFTIVVWLQFGHAGIALCAVRHVVKRVEVQKQQAWGVDHALHLTHNLADEPITEGVQRHIAHHGAKGGIRSAARFEMELEDPVLKRRMTHAYDIIILPVVR